MNKIIVLFLIYSVMALGAFEVAPSIQVINLEKPLTKQFHIKNKTKSLMKVKVYPERPKNQKSEELYLGDWIVVYPKLVYLKPGEKKVVRFAVRKPEHYETLKGGEYRSMLVFEQLPNKTFTTEDGKEGGGVGLQIIHKIITSVYGNKPEIKYSVDLVDLKVTTSGEGVFMEGEAINTGNATIDPKFKITFFKGGKSLKEVEKVMPKIVRENKERVKVKLDELPKGTNRVKVELREGSGEEPDGNGKIVIGEVLAEEVIIVQ